MTRRLTPRLIMVGRWSCHQGTGFGILRLWTRQRVGTMPFALGSCIAKAKVMSQSVSLRMLFAGGERRLILRQLRESLHDWPKIMGLRSFLATNMRAKWVAAAFQDAGMEYRAAPLPKSQLYLEGLPHFMRGLVSIPDQPQLIREFRLLERRRGAARIRLITGKLARTITPTCFLAHFI
jgi:hypothetical protein